MLEAPDWDFALILIQIGLFYTYDLYLNFEGAKNIHVLKVLIWGFGGLWGFLTGVWHLDLDLDMVTGL